MRLRGTELFVDLGAIEHNAKALIAATQTPLMAVVKGNAYGHGALQAARAALRAGAKALGVALVEEGLELREGGVSAPILVLGQSLERGLYEGAKADLSLCLSNIESVRALASAAKALRVSPKAQLKIDSGMGRIGFRSAGEAVLAYEEAIKGGITVEAVFTHLATADMPGGGAYLREQKARFEGVLLALHRAGFSGAAHAANSAAAILYPEVRYDMVRPGIALYGGYFGAKAEDFSLRPALTWKAPVVEIKRVEAGESLSYGRRYIAQEVRLVATLPVGYADGYRRGMFGRAEVLIKGRRAPVLGTICMDQILVDLSEIPGVELGDEAVLLGAQGKERISGAEMAGWAGETIDYEIFTGISARVPRVYE
ncbi:MAG: alanine racemase [Christensenellaceae bacterium]|nr:alanine racemase [Christensenellaceae bacterium]